MTWDQWCDSKNAGHCAAICPPDWQRFLRRLRQAGLDGKLADARPC